MRKRRSFTDDFKKIVETVLSGNMSTAHLLNSLGKHL